MVMFLYVFAWPKRGHVEKCRVCMFLLAKRKTCRKVSGFCVFFLGRTGEMLKSVVFFYVFWAKSKSVMFLHVFGFCVFLFGGRGGKCRKVLCLSKVSYFCVFFG